MDRCKLYALLTAFFIIIADQVTKMLVLTYVAGQQIALLPFFNFVLVWNKGVSFGLFNNGASISKWVLTGLSLLIVIFFIRWLLRVDSKGLAVAIAMIIGGALGNVIDRVRFGAVVDFLDFHAFGWHYPAFNVADSAIVTGIAFVVFDSLFFEPKRQKTEGQ